MSITLLVTAVNEIESFPRLARWANELDGRKLLVDSGSVDGTDAFAEMNGWEVIRHPYVDQPSQLNWALDRIEPEAWVLVIDADERPLFSCSELEQLLARAMSSGADAISFRRRNFFGDTWIRHGGFYPDRQVRLFRSHLRYETRPVHAHVDVDRRQILHADLDLEHLTYTDVDDYWTKVLQFTKLEDPESPSPSARPRWRRLRDVYSLLPAKAPFRFVYRYLVRLGFLDGRLGWHLALWSAVYEDIVDARRTLDPAGQA